MAVPEKDGAHALSADISAGGRGAPVLAIRGKIGSSQIDDLCLRAGAAFAHADVQVVIVDVSGVVEPDAAALDALAHLHLIAKRRGCEIRIKHTCRQLQELARFSGLSGVLLGCAESDDEAG